MATRLHISPKSPETFHSEAKNQTNGSLQPTLWGEQMLVGREGTGFIKTITALIAFPFCPLILKRKRRNVYDRCCANSNGAGNEGRREEYTD